MSPIYPTKRTSIQDRFDSKWEYRAPFTCWFWTGATARGYAKLYAGRRSPATAHILSYEWKHGPVPIGQVLDHFKCDNKECVNPDHVRPVSQRENILRSDSLGSRRAAQVECKRGHLLAGDNLRPGPGRKCRECKRITDMNRPPRTSRRKQIV
jgi:hypothetical protein